MGALLWKAANRANAAILEGSEANAVAATNTLKTYFILMGVITAIGIAFFVLYVILIFAMGATGALQALEQHGQY